MKKIVSLLTVLALGAAVFTACAAPEKAPAATEAPAAAETAQPAPEPKEAAEPSKTASLAFEANPSTGYTWTSFVLAGDSVEIATPEGTFTSSDATGTVAGAGGTMEFTLNSVKPGESLIRFSYCRPWESAAPEKEHVIYATVDDDLNLFVQDVTEGGVITGTVTDVNEAEHSVQLNAEPQGELIARFDAETALPAAGESVTLYTNGTMTMSLPPFVNVLAWSAAPGENARG